MSPSSRAERGVSAASPTTQSPILRVTGHVVVAPDKFKGSLSAVEVAEHVAAGLRRAVPGLDIRLAPVADGGDGTVEAAVAAGFRRTVVPATGPMGETVEAAIAVRGEVAVVELAQTTGLWPRQDPQPLVASSRGTGELLLAALDAGCTTILLGLGGSASTDGGAGMVQALGGSVTDAAGRELPPGGAFLAHASAVDLTRLDPRLANATLVVATDVDNPLLGPSGAAAVFAPQKGATPAQVQTLEDGLARWASVVADLIGRDTSQEPGAGAAGGVGFAALSLLGARQQSGISMVLDLIGFDDLLTGAALVITGEGSLDAQTLHGKAPVGVASAARKRGVVTVAVAGSATLDSLTLRAAGISAAYPLLSLEPDLHRCLTMPGPLVEQAAVLIAADWLTATQGPAPTHQAPLVARKLA